MDLTFNNKHLIISRDGNIVFEILLSQNNLVRYLKLGKISIQHTFDEEYDYDESTLQSWEVHGKVRDNRLFEMINNNGHKYDFYYSDTITITFYHDVDGQLQITYICTDFDEREFEMVTFDREEFNIIKPYLVNLLNSVSV